MKRIAWVLLIGLWCGSLAMAQIDNFSQRGKATQELKADGLVIAHPNLPINSVVTVTNTKTGKSIEATVSGRVPASRDRIADLSPGAWQELGLDKDNEIAISTPRRARQRPTPATSPTEPALAQETPPAPADPTDTPPTDTPPTQASPSVAQGSPATTGTANQPFTVTLHNFITVPEEQKTSPSAAPRRTPPPPAARQPAQPATATATPPAQTPQKFVPDPDLQRRLTATAVYVSPQQPVAVVPPPPPEAQKPAPIIQPQIVVVPSYNLTVAPVYQNQQMTTVHQPPAPPPPPPAPAYQPPPPPAPAYQPPPPAPVFLPPPPLPAYQPPPPLPAYQPPPPLPAYQPAPAPSPSATTVRVIPGYPDPASGKTYNLQVGSYSTANAANQAEQLIKSHGFNVTQELSKPYYRILVTNVPAAAVYATVQRLGAIGVEEVIIR